MDKYGENPLLLSFPLLYGLGLIILASPYSLAMTYIGLAILGAGGGIMSITGGPLFAKMYGTKHYASIKSLSIISMVLASAVSPPLTGYLLDTQITIDTVFLFFALYCFLAWIFMLWGIKRITNDEGKS